MSFSYSGDPLNSDKDKVRFLVGDTDAGSPLLEDAEVMYLIESEGTALAASIAAAIGIAAKFSRLMDESAGDVSKSYSQRHEHYLKLSSSLRQRNAEKCVVPFAGGISESDKTILETDTDVVQPSFTRDLHNNRLSSDNPASDDNDY